MVTFAVALARTLSISFAFVYQQRKHRVNTDNNRDDSASLSNLNKQQFKATGAKPITLHRSENNNNTAAEEPSTNMEFFVYSNENEVEMESSPLLLRVNYKRKNPRADNNNKMNPKK